MIEMSLTAEGLHRRGFAGYMLNDTNKVALVTGSSRGIGAVAARRLADQAFKVMVNHTCVIGHYRSSAGMSDT